MVGNDEQVRFVKSGKTHDSNKDGTEFLTNLALFPVNLLSKVRGR